MSGVNVLIKKNNRKFNITFYSMLLFVSMLFAVFVHKKIIAAAETPTLKTTYNVGVTAANVKADLYTDYSLEIHTASGKFNQELKRDWQYVIPENERKLIKKITFTNGVKAPYDFYEAFSGTRYDFTTDSNISDGLLGLEEINLKNLSLSTTKSVVRLFWGNSKLKTIDFEGVSAPCIKGASGMFRDCSSLTTIKWGTIGSSKFDDIGTMFCGCKSLKTIDLSSIPMDEVKCMDFTFYDCISLESVEFSPTINTKNLLSACYMFNQCESLTSVDVSNFNTSSCTNMNAMFRNCRSLEQVDVSKFNTSKVTNMSGMFEGCFKLGTIDVSNFKTANCTKMDSMFRDCKSVIALDVSNFNTSKVDDMYCMFYACKKLSVIDVSGFDTSEVTNMEYMFAACDSLTEIDISNFKTGNVTSTKCMFNSCVKLKKANLNGLDFSKNINMSEMFGNCQMLYDIDLKGIKLNETDDINMNNMFKDANNVLIDVVPDVGCLEFAIKPGEYFKIDLSMVTNRYRVNPCDFKYDWYKKDIIDDYDDYDDYDYDDLYNDLGDALNVYTKTLKIEKIPKNNNTKYNCAVTAPFPIFKLHGWSSGLTDKQIVERQKVSCFSSYSAPIVRILPMCIVNCTVTNKNGGLGSVESVWQDALNCEVLNGDMVVYAIEPDENSFATVYMDGEEQELLEYEGIPYFCYEPRSEDLTVETFEANIEIVFDREKYKAEMTIEAQDGATPNVTPYIAGNPLSVISDAGKYTFDVYKGDDFGFKIKPGEHSKIKVFVDDVEKAVYTATGTFESDPIKKDTDIKFIVEPIKVDLTIEVDETKASGSVTPTSATVIEGSSKDILISPNSHSFATVYVNDVKMDTIFESKNYTIQNITSSTKVKVEFDKIKRTVNITKSEQNGASGSVDPVGEKTVIDGDDLEINITVNEHVVAEVFVDDEPVLTAIEDTKFPLNNITSNKKVEVVFDMKKVDFVVEKELVGDATGEVSPNGTINAIEGSSKDITITPGSHCTAILYVNGIKIKEITTNENYTVSNIDSNTKVKVTFAKAFKTITVNTQHLNGAGGTISPDDNEFTVEEGSSKQFLVTLPQHTKATVSIAGQDDIIIELTDTFTVENVEDNIDIDVIFDYKYVNVTLQSEIENGAVGELSFSDGTYIYIEGSDFNMNVDIGLLSIAKVYIDESEPYDILESNNINISNLESDITIKVIFTRVQRNVSLVVKNEHEASGDAEQVSGGLIVYNGDSVTFKITPDANSVAYVYEDDELVAEYSSETLYTLDNITRDIILNVVFDKQTRKIKLDLEKKNGATGNVVVDNDRAYIGGSKTFDIIVGENCKASIYVDDILVKETDKNDTFILNDIDSNKNVKAVFDKVIKRITVTTKNENGGEGTVSPNPIKDAIYGTSVDFVINLASFSKADIYEDDIKVKTMIFNGIYQVANIIKDTALKVVFGREVRHVKVELEEKDEAKGSVNPIGDNSVFNGDSIRLDIKVSNPYIAYIYEDGELLQTLNSDSAYDIKNIIRDINIKVVFNKEEEVKTSSSRKKKEEVKPEELVIDDLSNTGKKKTYSGNAYIVGYKDSTFRPNNKITRAELAAIMARISDDFDPKMDYTSQLLGCKDVKKTSWAANYVGYCIKENIMSIDDKGKFNANNKTTRAEAAKVIYTFKGLDMSDENTKFSDVKGRWYEKYVTALEDEDLIEGYNDGTFKGKNGITRAEMLTIINRTIGRYSNDNLSTSQVEEIQKKFKDITTNKAWYLKEIYAALFSE